MPEQYSLTRSALNRPSQIIRHVLVGALLALYGIGDGARAEFNDGVVAYLMGDYDKAFTTMQSLAETADHGYAQYYLGMMYLRGQGGEQNNDLAGQWFRRAAQNHISQAQYQLGQLYMKGQGVPRDYELAYAWLRTSATLEHTRAEQAAEKARARIPAPDLPRAEAVAEEFIEKYGPQETLDPSQPIRIEN